jgi:hypothetical protein
MAICEINPPHDITNQSCYQRCLSMISQIKTQKAQQLLSLPITQNTILPKKRCLLKEVDSVRTGRLQSYTNWPHVIPSREIMSLNGWFYCNTNDRTICIYCDTVCHNWTNNDDPYEVHARLAPECPFVLSISSSSSSSKDSPSTINQNLNETFQPRHTSMCEIFRRQETFNNKNWTQTSPSTEDLALAGFFYSGTGNSVTCFYCDGSLHQWGANDNPKIEHGRWFPSCLYANHLCGDRLHAKIQMTKKQLSAEKINIDKETLIRLVNARLDLPIVQRLRTKYQLSVIKRCIEDQFKMNHDDFKSDNDFEMACFILQKQIDAIRGNPDKIITPSQNQLEVSLPEPSTKKLEECIICLTEERQLACMPCGHLCTCVPCGYALRACPICRQKIQSFVRIYC